MLFKLIRHSVASPTASTPPVSAPLLKRVHQLWRTNKAYRAGAKRKSQRNGRALVSEPRRLAAAGKKPKVILVALNAMLRDGAGWQPQAA